MSDTLSSDALLLVLETVNKQAAQIKRLETIVAGGGSSTGTGLAVQHGAGCHNGPLAAELQQLPARLAALEQQAADDAAASAGRLQQLEQRVQSLQQQGQQLQQQLGAPAAQQHRAPTSSTSSPAAWAPQGTTTTTHSSGGQRSMTVRLQQLERQVECLAGSAADAEDKLAAASSAVHALDRQLAKQLSNVRADVQQALAVTAGSVKAELEAAAAARDRQAARQLQKQLQELSAAFQCRLSECQRAAAADCKRQAAAGQEAAESRLSVLRAQVDRLDAAKADVGLVTNYTGQVADVFEQLATTVADSTQASIAQLLAQQQELRGALTSLVASKVDNGSMLQHQYDCQQQLLELQRSVAAAHSRANDASLVAAGAQAAAEPVEGLRLQLVEAQGSMAALHAQTASLEASLGSTCSGQQQHAQELQQLAQSHQGLQQQLLALGNHVDPAAAAQLAAAMNGDESALSFQPLGDTQQLRLSLDLLAGPDGGEDSWLTGCYMQAGATSAHGGAGASSTGTQQQQQPESSGGALAAFAAAMQRVQQQQGGAGGVPRSSAGASRMAPSHGSGGGGARMGAVLRHLPVAVRLQRLEAAVRELCGDAASKATDGELQALAGQHEQLLERLHALSATCEGLSRSSSSSLQQLQQLQQQVEALSISLEDRPSRAQVAAALSDAEAAAAAAASKASLAAVQQLQQQLADLQEGVAAAHTGVQLLKASEALASDRAAQLRGQLMSELDSRASEMQQTLTQQMRAATANQEAAAAQHGSPPKLASLESKLRGLVGEVDGMREQAALTARMQDKHTTMVSALEAALQAQGSKHATLLQQLQLELKEAVGKAAQAHVRTGAVEAALQEQAAALAAAVAELTDKASLAQDALQQFQARMEQQLLEHVKQEEERWEAWLPQFVRSMEQRPTAGQLQKQLEAAQQQTESNAQEAAVARIQCVAAAADTALRSQLHALAKQLHTLQDRTLLLEQGTGIGEEADDAQAGGVQGPQQAAPTAAAAAPVSGHQQHHHHHHQQQPTAGKPTAQVAAAWKASPALNQVPPLPLPVAQPKLRKTAVLPARAPSQPAAVGARDKGRESAAGSPAAVSAAAPPASTLTTSQELVALAARVPRPPAAAAATCWRRASTSSSCSCGADDVPATAPEPSQAAGDPAAADEDCEAELEQLLALQQQVQSCLISNGCVAVGRHQRKSSAERQAGGRSTSRRSGRQAGAASPGRACDEADGSSSVPASPSPAAGEEGGAPADSDAGSGQQPALQPPQRKERHHSRRSAVAGQQRQQTAVTEADVQQLLALQHQVLMRLEQQGCVPTPVGQQQTPLGQEETSASRV